MILRSPFYFGFMDLNICMNTWQLWEEKDKKTLLTPFYIPGTALSTGGTEKVGKNPSLMELAQ